jgi:sulfate permease, SulP family
MAIPINFVKPGDIIAGVSVAALLIPQSIAYASLMGLPPIIGIYASILPPIIAAFFVSSPYLQTGPVAMTCLLSLGVLTSITSPVSVDYIGLAALLALLIGFVRVLIGLGRSGYIAYLMSPPLISGFTAGAAVLIISTQIPTFLGVTSKESGIIKAAVIAITHPDTWSIQALALGSVSVLIIVIGRRIHTLFPGILIAVALGIIYSHVADYDSAVIGSLPSGLPTISISFPWEKVSELIVPSIIIALVGFAEPAAIARTMATQNRQPWSVDKEFVSQGMANIASGISGCFPVGGSFSRTIINFKAGGQTRWSGAITGLTVLMFLPVVSILSPLPRTVLAAIIISAVFSLIDIRALYRILRTSIPQGCIAWSTFALTLILTPRVDIAVLIGIGLSVAIHLWREKRIEIIVSYNEGTLNLAPVGVLFFGSAPTLGETLIQTLANHPDAKKLIIDLHSVGRLDYSATITLQQVAMDAERSGLEVKIIPGGTERSLFLLNRVLGADSPWLSNSDS